MKINKFFSIFAVLIGVTLFVPQALAVAFGVSPPWIANENLKPGSSFVYVIDLSTNDPSRDRWVEAEIMGDPEVMEWLTIRDQENLIMHRGQEHTSMQVELNVPDDARVGRYKGTISVTANPRESGDGEVSLILGGRISVDLVVINYDVTDYWVKSMSLNPITKGEPLSMNLIVKNLGNTPLTELQTQVQVTDYRTGENVAAGSASRLEAVVYPHTVKETSLKVPVGEIPSGVYWVNVSALKGGKTIYQNRLYQTVDDLPVNSVVETAVTVGEEGEMKAAALDENSISLKTSVTVRAPLTNQLIGVVIILLGVIIIITARIQRSVYKRRRH